MSKKPKQFTVSYHGVIGHGATKSEAKEEAGRVIESLVHDTGDIAILHSTMFVAFIYRNLFDWGYTLEPINGWGDGKLIKLINPCPSASYGHASKEDAIKAVCFHVSQNEWGHESADGFSFAYDDAQRTELQGWAHWQRDYRRLKGEGKSDEDAHRLARSRPEV